MGDCTKDWHKDYSKECGSVEALNDCYVQFFTQLKEYEKDIVKNSPLFIGHSENCTDATAALRFKFADGTVTKEDYLRFALIIQ